MNSFKFAFIVTTPNFDKNYSQQIAQLLLRYVGY